MFNLVDILGKNLGLSIEQFSSFEDFIQWLRELENEYGFRGLSSETRSELKEDIGVTGSFSFMQCFDSMLYGGDIGKEIDSFSKSPFALRLKNWKNIEQDRGSAVEDIAFWFFRTWTHLDFDFKDDKLELRLTDIVYSISFLDSGLSLSFVDFYSGKELWFPVKTGFDSLVELLCKLYWLSYIVQSRDDMARSTL